MSPAGSARRLRAESPAEPTTAVAHDYSVLGGVLRSSLEFPELPPADGAEPDWSLRVCPVEPPAVPTERLGQREVGQERYTLSRTPIGVRLEYSHAGCFDISARGDSISWYPGVESSLELARAIVLGPALSLALELRGCLCLHGSAVAIGGRAVAFLGGKFHGKSTLATALTAAGAMLVSDDLIAIDDGHPVRVRAGVPSVRLWQDAASELAVDRLCDVVLAGVKTTATGFTGRTMTAPHTELSAIYLLDPVASGAEQRACWRSELHGAHAAIALAHQTKLPPNLVGTAGAGVQLRKAVHTAANVPVWRLHVVRDFARLDAVVSEILAWHSVDGAPTMEPQR